MQKILAAAANPRNVSALRAPCHHPSPRPLCVGSLFHPNEGGSLALGRTLGCCHAAPSPPEPARCVSVCRISDTHRHAHTRLLLIGLCDLGDGYLLIDNSEPRTSSSLQLEDLREATEPMGVAEPQRWRLCEFQADPTLSVTENKTLRNSRREAASNHIKA